MSVKVSTLPSGLQVVTDEMAHLETASLGVWVGAGSRHEQVQEHGLSHLLEHMAFKGTKRRSARDIAEDIESAGGDLNAATSSEHTAYYAHVLAEDTPLALDILADILTESTFDLTELDREKGVILQEISSIEDTPDDLVFDLFSAAAFPGQPIGRTILGTPENVSGFSRQAIGSYLERHYQGSSMIIGAAGAIKHEQIVEESSQRFHCLSSGANRESHPAPVPAQYRGGEARLKRKLEQAHIVIGFEGLPYDHEDQYAIQIFANLLGGGMSSRLFQEVREKRGLAYTIYAFHWGYEDTGLFGFYAATGSKDVAELMPVVLDCVAETAATLSEAEVCRAKAQMKVSVLASLESPSARAEQIARQLMIFRRVLTRTEMIEKIDNLGLENIRRAGIRALKTKPTVAAVGPIGKVFNPERVAESLRGV